MPAGAPRRTAPRLANLGGPTPAGQSHNGKNCTDCDVGDPINPGNGNEFLVQQDYASRSAFPLAFARYYNSTSSVVSTKIGQQWRHTFDRSITTSSTDYSVTIANVNRQDGKVDQFYSRDGVTWLPTNDLVDTLLAVRNSSGILTGWTFKTSDDETEAYDANGRLLSITNRTGQQQVMHYNAQAQLDQVADSYGRKLLLGYDSSGRIQTLTDPASGQFTYGYDASNNLVSVRYPDQAVLTYRYNESGLTSGTNLPNALTGIVDENNARYVTIGYDASGRANLDYLGANAKRFSIAYPASGANSPVVTDPLGTQRTYTFIGTNGVNEITSFSSFGSQGSCGICSSAIGFVYDQNGFISQGADGNGNLTRYSIDTRGLEEKRIEGYGTSQSRETDTAWEANFHLPHQVSEPGRQTTYSHDGSGNLLSVTIADTQTGVSRTTAYSNYNALAEPQTVTGPRTDLAQITRYQYDAQGNLVQITDPLGHISKVTRYDAHGNPLVMLDSNGVETDFGYDPRQRLTSKTVAGALTQYKYDSAGNLKTVIRPNGSQVGYGYDTAHRLTDITDNLNNHIHYTLDGLGNRTQENTYDPGAVLARTLSRSFDPATGWVQHEYGAHGQDTQYTQDGEGNTKTLTQHAVAGDFQTVNSYDPLNRLQGVQDAAQGQITYGYDSFGNLETVQDQSMITTAYTYNGLGDLVELNSPDTGVTLYTPDSAGNVSVKRDARLVSASYSHDALNRVKSVSYPNAAENITYYYDGSNYPSSAPYAVGRLTGVQDQSGSTVYYYNPRGTLGSEVHTVSGVAYITRYAYDGADTLQSITYPSGDQVSYRLNAISQIVEVDATVGGSSRVLATGIQYLPFGPWKQLTLGNGVPTTRSIDQDYRVSAIVSGGTVNRSYAYADRRDNITGIIDNITSNNSQTFGYDALSRLTAASGGYGSLAYQYNASGDRTKGGLSLSPLGYTYYSGTHHLDGAGLKNYTYDQSGNPATAGLLGSGGTTFAYNDANRLASVSSLTSSASYTYNALGQRVTKTTSGLLGATTVFSYDQSGLMLQENSGAGVPGSEYFYLNGEPLALYTKPNITLGGSQIYYYHNDHLGTPLALTDNSASSVWSASYQPFGSASVSPLASVTNKLRLSGQYYDAETQLHQNGFRDYDPSLGRYVESDPIGLSGGINTYAYAGGNPISRTDPSGLVVWTGTIFNIGAGFIQHQIYALHSQCVNGEQAYVRVNAWGVGPGDGITLAGSTISFDDGLSFVDPNIFNGLYAQVSVGISAGIGGGFNITRLGGVEIPGDFGLEGGIDASEGAVIGQSTVTQAVISKCGCSK